jgi:hypothetical protein
MTDVQHLQYGRYLLNPGEGAADVARRVYGDVHKATVLLEVNKEDWDLLERIDIPGKKGRLTTLQEGEGVQALIARMFPGQLVSTYVQPYFIWNGGKDGWLKPGDEVFIPDR